VKLSKPLKDSQIMTNKVLKWRAKFTLYRNPKEMTKSLLFFNSGLRQCSIHAKALQKTNTWFQTNFKEFEFLRVPEWEDWLFWSLNLYQAHLWRKCPSDMSCSMSPNTNTIVLKLNSLQFSIKAGNASPLINTFA